MDLDQLAALAFRLLLGLLARRRTSSAVASSVSTTSARTSSICSELSSSEGKTELIWSWVT
jgi:hypothetical protein